MAEPFDALSMSMPKCKLFTPAVLHQLPRWVASGQSPAEIAARIGCTAGTLKVRCSQEGISFATPTACPRVRRVEAAPAPRIDSGTTVNLQRDRGARRGQGRHRHRPGGVVAGEDRRRRSVRGRP
jgi:hypothetical protein